MDALNDIHQTAREWFAVKLQTGALPDTLVGGELDGLQYFPVIVDGIEYFLTNVGLFSPPDRECCQTPRP